MTETTTTIPPASDTAAASDHARARAVARAKLRAVLSARRKPTQEQLAAINQLLRDYFY